MTIRTNFSYRRPEDSLFLGQCIGRGDVATAGMRSAHAFHWLCNPAGL